MFEDFSARKLQGSILLHLYGVAVLLCAALLAWSFVAEAGGLRLWIEDWQAGPNLLKADRWQPLGVGYEGRGSQFVCGNGPLTAKLSGARQTVELHQAVPEPIEFVAWSKAENVNGVSDAGYTIQMNLVYEDGTCQWGFNGPFATGTHDWQRGHVRVTPRKPVERVELSLRFCNHTGRAVFRDPVLRVWPAPEPPRIEHLTAFAFPDGRTQISWVTDQPMKSGSVYYGEGDALDHRSDSDGRCLRNHVVVLPHLTSNRPQTAQVRVLDRGREILRSGKVTFNPGVRPVLARSRSRRVRLRVNEPTPYGRTDWPITSGIPFAEGELASADDVALVNADGTVVPGQFEVMATWPNGSVRWLLVDFQATTHETRPAEHVLVTRPSAAVNPNNASIISEESECYVLNPGPIRIRVNRDSFAFPGNVTVDSENVDPVAGGSAELVTAEGTVYRAGAPERISIETNGPIRGVVRIEGHYVSDSGQRLMCYRSRITAYRGRPDVRVQWTLGNDHTAETFTELKRVSLKLPLAGSEITASLADSHTITVSDSKPLTVLQDYDDHAFVTRDGVTAKSEREAGFVRVQAGDVTVDAMIRDFWQTYPKGLRVVPDALVLDLLPELPEDQFTKPGDRADERQVALFYCYRSGCYLLKRGMEYTSDVVLSFRHKASELPSYLATHWQKPLFAVAPSTHYCSSGAFWWVEPQRPGEFPRYFDAFQKSFAEIEAGRQDRHEYGWMNYGD